MTGNDSIDLSLANIHLSWQKFIKGKKKTLEIDEFIFYLENNLFELYRELNNKSYRHGEYRNFFVSDNKRRKISVARIKDRVVHRLVYEYLLNIFDRQLDFDAWSCRKNKGLVGAIERAQNNMERYRKSFVWRADIKKFFDNVDHLKLLEILRRKINDGKAYWLIGEIISSFSLDLPFANRERERERELGHWPRNANW